MRTLPMKQALLTAAALGFLALPVAAQTDSAKAPAPAPSAAAPAPSADALPPKHVSWSFNGPFGTYDRAALQRGFQVYKEVCSACHSLSLVAIRNLADRGGPEFTEAQVAAFVEWLGDLRRRYAEHGRSGSARRGHLPLLGLRAQDGGAQAHRLQRHDL